MGCVLMKPDLSHVETFPDFFQPNKTYLPVGWDLLDLASKFESTLLNKDQMSEIASNAQKLFLHYSESEVDLSSIFVESLSLRIF